MRLLHWDAIIIALLVLVIWGASQWHTIRLPASTSELCKATDDMGRRICAELRQ